MKRKESSPLGRGSGRKYHHGDARHALIDAAGELLESVGAAALSLRQLAERAGLSRQAPYNHFADKEALLAELVRAGFERLAHEVREARGAGSGEPALADAAAAYIGFARRSPALFRLMFSRELVDRSRFPDVEAAAAATFEELVSVIMTIVPQDEVGDAALAAWCVVHGYATLCNESELEPASARALRARQFAHLFVASSTKTPTP